MNPGPVRIARIVSRLAVGGPARHVCSLTAQLNSQRFQTWLICGPPDKGEHGGAEIAKEAGVEPIYVEQLRRRLGFWDLNASLKISRLLAQIRPQIVATHTAKAGALGRSVALLRRLATHEKVRLIHTFHGHVFNNYFNAPITRAFISVERYLASLTDLIVTVSPSIRRQLIDEYQIVSADKVRVVPLGFDFGWLQDLPRHRGWLRARLHADDSTFIFGIVGRLANIKNPGMVLRAFARMLRQEPMDARLVVVGDGELQQPLRVLARELAIEDRVLFCGWILDRARIFSDLDATCLSSNNEGTPVCLIESLAARVPVIATRVGGVEDVVTDKRDGELVGAGDEEAFAAAMIRAARGRAAIHRDRSAVVCNNYSTSRLVKDIENLYEEVLHDDRPRGATLRPHRRPRQAY